MAQGLHLHLFTLLELESGLVTNPRERKGLKYSQDLKFSFLTDRLPPVAPNLHSPVTVFLCRKKKHVEKRNPLKTSAQQRRITIFSFSPFCLWTRVTQISVVTLGKHCRGGTTPPPQGNPASSSDIGSPSDPHHPSALASS